VGKWHEQDIHCYREFAVNNVATFSTFSKTTDWNFQLFQSSGVLQEMRVTTNAASERVFSMAGLWA